MFYIYNGEKVVIRLFPDRIVLQERADFGKGLQEALSSAGVAPQTFDDTFVIFTAVTILAWSVYLTWCYYK